jgi:Domain of unknown function (DUF5667)
MNEFFTQFKTKARTIKLSHDEKQAMRVQLYTYFERNPVQPVVAQSPARPVPSMYYFFSARYMIPIALVLVIGLSSGTAFAAQSALPGQPLYAVKINVNEKVATALATTPQAKAQVNAQLATTRLEEAETLASTGKLDATTTAQLADNFAAHATAAQANTASLQAQDPGAAAQIGAEFDSTLAAHGAILAQIGDDSSNAQVTQNSNALAVQVQQASQQGTEQDGQTASQGGTVVAIATDTSAPVTPAAATPANSPMRVTTFAAKSKVQLPDEGQSSDASSSTSDASSTTVVPAVAVKIVTPINPKDPQIAAALGAQASTSIASTIQDFDAIQSALDATTSAQINTQISGLQDLYAKAATELSAGNAADAVSDFTRALRTSTKLDTYLKAGKKFNVSLLSSLITMNGINLRVPGSNKGVIIKVTAPDASGGNENEKAPNVATTTTTTDGSDTTVNATDSNVGSNVNVQTSLY